VREAPHPEGEAQGRQAPGHAHLGPGTGQEDKVLASSQLRQALGVGA
jgi:hypothetical protein